MRLMMGDDVVRKRMVTRFLLGSVLVAVCLAANAAQFSGPPPEAYLDPIDRQIAATGIAVGNRTAPCTISVKREMISGNVVEHVEYVPTDKCVRMTPPKRFKGLWRFEFEGSQFCEEPATTCEFTRDGETAWLSERTGDYDQGRLYRVEFIGRKTVDAATYGHFGMYAHEVIVDRFLSTKQMGKLKD